MFILRLFILAVVMVQSSKPAYAEKPQQYPALPVGASQGNYFVSLVDGVTRAVNAEGIHRINLQGQHTRFVHEELVPENVLLFQPLSHHKDIVLSADLKLFVTHQQQLVPLTVTRFYKSDENIVILHTAMGIFMADTQNRLMLKVSPGKIERQADWAIANSGKALFVFSLILLLLTLLLRQWQRNQQEVVTTSAGDTSLYLPPTLQPRPQAHPQAHENVTRQAVKPVILLSDETAEQAQSQLARWVPTYNDVHLLALAELVRPVGVAGSPECLHRIQRALPQTVTICSEKVFRSDKTSNMVGLLPEPELDRIVATHFALNATQYEGCRALFIPDFLNARITNAEQADFYARFLSVLQDNFKNDECNASYVAEKLAVSSRNLSRKLRQIFNASFTDLLKQYRLCQSCDGLLQGERITQVAISSGFGTSSYYAKCFKRYTGMTPRKFQLESGCLPDVV